MLVMDAITGILKREGISTLFCFPTTPIIEAAVAGGLRWGHQRPAGRRSCDAIRAGRRERLCRHRLGLFGFDPDPPPAARPSARNRADVPLVQFDPDLRQRYQARSEE